VLDALYHVVVHGTWPPRGSNVHRAPISSGLWPPASRRPPRSVRGCLYTARDPFEELSHGGKGVARYARRASSADLRLGSPDLLNHLCGDAAHFGISFEIRKG
jgi:hypothetical protein